MRIAPRLLLWSLSLLTAGLSGCDTGQGPPDGGSEPLQVGGRVTGLTGTGLVLRNRGGNDLAITGDGAFTFPGAVLLGDLYEVTVAQQPVSPAQSCTVSRGSGVVTAPVNAIVVSCQTPSYTVGGVVLGLEGEGLALLNNGDRLWVTPQAGAPVSFLLNAVFQSGASYDVTVELSPRNPDQTCEVSGGSGTVVAGNVATVVINCVVNTFTVGGEVTGLSGRGLVLRNQDGVALPVNANGTFAFATQVESGADYAVTVDTQPSSPTQLCTVSRGTGTVSSANVRNVRVECITSTYTLSGTVSGLVGSGLQLGNNGANPRKISADGPFTFTAPVPSGASYEVTVLSPPSFPLQACTVSNGSGTVVSSNITSIQVVCQTRNFTVGGTVSGLLGTGLQLRDGAEVKAITANGSFTFDTSRTQGSSYQVVVETQPGGPVQACLVSNGSGTVTSGDITDIQVSCQTGAYFVGGTVSGLLGSGLTLTNNGSSLPISRDGRFNFLGLQGTGSNYDVRVGTPPTAPSQTCTVLNGSGTIGSTHVTDIQVSCVLDSFTVGGTVSGLEGSGLVLRNNGTDDLAITGEGSFTFVTPLPSGEAYEVTIASQPSTGPPCLLTRASGFVADRDVTTVSVTCGGAPPDNDHRASATFLSPLTSSDYQAIAPFDTLWATHDAQGSCGCGDGADVFFGFTLDTAAVIYAEIQGADFDPTVFLQDAAGANLTDSGLADGVVCSDDPLAGCASGGPAQLMARLAAGTYYLVVTGCGRGQGNLRLAALPAPNGDLTPLPPGSSSHVVVTTGTGRVTTGLCGGTAGTTGPEDAFYWYTCPAFASAVMTASTCAGGNADAFLYQRSAGRAPVEVCSDDVQPAGCPSNGTAAIITPVIPSGGGLHLLYAERFGMAGTFPLSVSRP